MDLKKYDKLRKKIDTKDFEGKNKELDKWLFRFSFVGNASSIFFAYFLVFPSLLKAIKTNFIDGNWGTIIAFILTLIFLSIFEVTKRYFIRNFSNDYVTNHRKIGLKMMSWLMISISIVIISFYLSITGSKNLATTSSSKNDMAKIELAAKTDSLTKIYDNKKLLYVEDNKSLREVNTDLRIKLKETPLNYITARKEYQKSIDKNTELIKDNKSEIESIDSELQSKIDELEADLSVKKSGNEENDMKNIVLFVIIVCFNEIIIIGGLYFREYFEYNLYLINQDKFEKIYKKKDRYRALLTFIYADGKLSEGDKVMSGLELKAAVAENANIQNSNKFVDDFLRDMDRLNIFTTVGKRRKIAVSFIEALDIIENFDDTYRILENIK